MEQQVPARKGAGRGAKRKELGTRPVCSKHPNDRVWSAGSRRRWSAYHEHQEFFCVHPTDKKLKHRLIGDVIGRHPARHNPAGADICPHCEHGLTAVEGPRAGRDYTFAFREQAALLVRVGQGGPNGSFRKSSRATRQRATRYAKPRPARIVENRPKPNYTALKEPSPPGRISKQPALAMAYVDQYAPIIAKALLPTRWPEVVAIDSKPYKRKELIEDPRNEGSGTYNSGGKEYGEVMAAVDHTVRGDSKLVALRLEGGKDQASWEAFFRSLEGQPRWVVADQDQGLEAALANAWPETTLYNCDAHLRLNAAKYLVKDGIPLKRVKSRSGVKPNEELVFDTHPLHLLLLLEAVQTPEGWAAFKAGVERWVPDIKVKGIRKWIRDTEPLIVYQMELRAENPDMWLVSNGAVEAQITTMSHAIGFRMINYKNASRLQKTIDLIMIELRHDADEAVYAKILEDHFRACSGRPAPDWKSARIGVGRGWTVDGIVQYAIHRNAIAKVTQDNEVRAQREADRKTVEKAALEAVGLSQRLKKIRSHGPRKYTRVEGRVVNDYVEPVNLRDEWDTERNGALDPAVVKGTYRKHVWWVCRAHADGPGSHLHRWQATVVQRATTQTGCPCCMGRQLCAWNNLGQARPDIARFWDQDANGTVTPFDVLPGTPDKFYWRCDRDPSHPAFPSRVSQMTGQGTRCGLRHPDQTADRARTTVAVRGRMQRALARQALPEAPGTDQMAVTTGSGPSLEAQVAVEGVSTDLQGTFWDVTALPPKQQLDLFDVA